MDGYVSLWGNVSKAKLEIDFDTKARCLLTQDLYRFWVFLFSIQKKVQWVLQERFVAYPASLYLCVFSETRSSG